MSDVLREVLPTLPTTHDEAQAAFDSAAPVMPEFMTGVWRGAELPTGHPLDGLLECSGWWGKRFVDAETVDPLLMDGRSGRQWPMNPGLAPLKLAQRVAVPSMLAPLLRWAVAVLRPILRTRKPRARLRSVSYRGQATAAMVYDQIPVIDYFRKLPTRSGADVVIGAMDLRGTNHPYFFVLRREQA